LPDLEHDDARTRARRYMTALAEGEGREREHVIGATLDWLWRVITSPVLDAIEHRASRESERTTRTRHACGGRRPVR
jgi:hypothetical protein